MKADDISWWWIENGGKGRYRRYCYGLPPAGARERNYHFLFCYIFSMEEEEYRPNGHVSIHNLAYVICMFSSCLTSTPTYRRSGLDMWILLLRRGKYFIKASHWCIKQFRPKWIHGDFFLERVCDPTQKELNILWNKSFFRLKDLLEYLMEL